MSTVTMLSEVAINAFSTMRVELVEADKNPAVIIINWPANASVIHPRRFPDVASTIARVFATAATQLASIKRDRKV